MSFFSDFFKDVTNKDNWKTLISKEEWEKVLPTPREEALRDWTSNAFKRAWNKAVLDNQQFGIEIPQHLINTYRSKLKYQEMLETIGSKEDDYSFSSSSEYAQHKEGSIPSMEDSIPPHEELDEEPTVEVDSEKGGYIRKARPQRKTAVKSVSSAIKSKAKWAITEVGGLELLNDDCRVVNGARSSYLTFSLTADSIRKANGGKPLEAIRKTLGSSKARAKATLQNGGDLMITLTSSDFEPIYTENHLSLLKKEGDFLLGEVEGKIRVMNIKEMSQAHLGVVGGSESGKSYFLNNVIQSLIYSSPSAEYHLFSPKSDTKGGDFAKFAQYPQVKTCRIIDSSPTAEMDMLVELRDLLEKQLGYIHQQKEVPLQVIAVDELVYLLETKGRVSKPKKPSDNDEDWEWARYEKKMNSYKIDLLREDIGELLEDFAKLGRKIGRLIVGTQLLNKTVMSNQFMQNLEQISFKVANGNGTMSGFNSLAEDLLPRGDGLVSDPRTNEVINFQSLLATP